MATTPYAGEAALVARLRAGDEAAFAFLVDMYGRSMLRLARLYVRDRAAAEEVVADTWLAVLRGIDRFEGRSSLRTWIFSILVNLAKTRGVRESRTVPFSALAGDDAESGEPSVPGDRFLPAGSPWPGTWSSGPAQWNAPLQRLLSQETRGVIDRAIEGLPEMQRRGRQRGGRRCGDQPELLPDLSGDQDEAERRRLERRRRNGEPPADQRPVEKGRQASHDVERQQEDRHLGERRAAGDQRARPGAGRWRRRRRG